MYGCVLALALLAAKESLDCRVHEYVLWALLLI
jgi:hypothetical protein